MASNEAYGHGSVAFEPGYNVGMSVGNCSLTTILTASNTTVVPGDKTRSLHRISVLPFPTSLNKSDGTQQLTRWVRSAMTDILMRCNDRCQEYVRLRGYPVGSTPSAWHSTVP